MNFSNFNSRPFPSNHFSTNSSILGKGFFEIETVPPRSETNITIDMNSVKSDSNEKITTYIRSDERVGLHDTIVTSIFYLVLGVFYILLFIYFVYDTQNIYGLNKYGAHVSDELQIMPLSYNITYARKHNN